jgi:DNA modification methylase
VGSVDWDVGSGDVSVSVFLQDADFTLYQGDALEVLRGLPDESVHMCVTSPPYWGLRDYGTGSWEGGDKACSHERQSAVSRASSGLDGATTTQGGAIAYRDVCGKCGARRVDRQLGLEETPELYVERMVAVFREVRRVLRADGTLWLNIGDSYAGGGPDRGGTSNIGRTGTRRERPGHERVKVPPLGLKPKDLVGIPWRLAFALQADGWYLRADVIWSKPNPMPESVTDRPTKAHEYVFLLSKSPRYFFDAEAVRESAQNRGEPDESKLSREQRDVPREGGPGRFTRGGGSATGFGSLTGRNVRSVWEIATEPYPDAHFATYPTRLVERCILAGSSARGCCPVCGAPWTREVDISYAKAPGGGYGGRTMDAAQPANTTPNPSPAPSLTSSSAQEPPHTSHGNTAGAAWG